MSKEFVQPFNLVTFGWNLFTSSLWRKKFSRIADNQSERKSGRHFAGQKTVEFRPKQIFFFNKFFCWFVALLEVLFPPENVFVFLFISDHFPVNQQVISPETRTSGLILNRVDIMFSEIGVNVIEEWTQMISGTSFVLIFPPLLS